MTNEVTLPASMGLDSRWSHSGPYQSVRGEELCSPSLCLEVLSTLTGIPRRSLTMTLTSMLSHDSQVNKNHIPRITGATHGAIDLALCSEISIVRVLLRIKFAIE